MMLRPTNISARLITIFCIALWVLSCGPGPEPEVPFMGFTDGVLVINEGNFQQGNASVDFIGDPVQQSVFATVNERPLGDVAQSFTRVGERGYIVVNNSGKIEVVRLPGLESECTISGLGSPRYMTVVGNNKAYVSDLYCDCIHVLDLGGCQKTGTIPTGGWTEQMYVQDTLAYVTQTGTDQLLLIHVQTDVLLDSMEVGREPNSLVRDRDGKLWVLGSGGLQETQAQLVRVNMTDRTVEARFTFADLAASPEELHISPAGNVLYYLDQGKLWSMAIADTTLPASPFVPAGSNNFYGLGVDPSGDIWVSDAGDFVQQGRVFRYSSTGNLEGSWPVGVIPGAFAFD